MATWNDLPNEIRDHILRFACVRIIAEYEELESGPRPSPWFYTKPTPFSAIRPPTVLSLFAHLSRTCRYFHIAITNRIKFERQSTATILTRHQRQKFDAIDFTTITYDEDNDGQQAFDRYCFEWLVSSIGLFWNNPLILEDLTFAKISQVDMFECFPLIYKLFENWGQIPSEPAPPHSDRVILPLRRFEWVGWKKDRISVIGFVVGASNRYENELQLCSIDAVLNTKPTESTRPDTKLLSILGKDDLHDFESEFPFFKDILMDPPNTWWLLSGEPQASGTRHWYIWNSTTTKVFYQSGVSNRSYPLEDRQIVLDKRS